MLSSQKRCRSDDERRALARRIAATLPQLYDIDWMEPGGEPVPADMAGLVETVLKDAEGRHA